MDSNLRDKVEGFSSCLLLEEEPMGMIYTNRQPEGGFTPKPGELPTREKEKHNAVNWQNVFGNFSCVMGNIWRARRKKTAAWFSAEHFGCPGGAFWLGFMKPQSETIIHYVSSGIPDQMEGELYCESPDMLRKTFEAIDPPPAPAPYCVIKPLSLFAADETPDFVVFFTSPEILCGLHQLAFFVTNDPEVVVSPWCAACGSIGTFPLTYRLQGKSKAVIGGWDISARKFFRTNELSFTVPYPMFEVMINRYKESFLTRKNWEIVQKKIQQTSKSSGIQE